MYQTESEAAEKLRHTLSQGPASFGQPGTRWRLATLLEACPWLAVDTLPGLSQVLKRLKIRWKRARAHVHSPDPNYIAKLGEVRFWVLHFKEDLEAYVVLFEDEFTLYRHPSLSWAYSLQGPSQPLAEMGYTSNKVWRLAGALNAWTGQVTYVDRSRLSLPHMTQFYQKLADTYPEPQTIKLVQDNWPMHYHPDLLAALQPQVFPYGVHRPPSWPSEPNPSTPRLNLPIAVVPLPTYAPWTNPIEKLWRFLYQEVLHLHSFGDDWVGLKQAVARFLDQFAQGSPELMRYVGLGDPTLLYRVLFPAE